MAHKMVHDADIVQILAQVNRTVTILHFFPIKLGINFDLLLLLNRYVGALHDSVRLSGSY